MKRVHGTVTALRQAALIVLAGIALGTAANAVAPWSIPWIGKKRTLTMAADSILFAAPPPLDQRVPASNERVAEPLSISLEQAKRLWDSGDGVFIDARPPYEFSGGYIPGARNIPYEEIEYYLDEIAALPKDSILVVYCAGESCDLSVHLGDELTDRGFPRVRVFFGGWVDWEQAGFPVADGTE